MKTTPDSSSPEPPESRPRSPRWRAIARIAVGSVAGAACLWLAFRDLPIAAVWDNLGRTKFLWVVPAVAAILGATLVRAWRWSLLFPPEQSRPSLRTLWAILSVGQMINILVPARAGEVARLFILQHTDGRSKTETLATIGVEKLLDSVTFLVLVAAVSAWVTLPPSIESVRDSFVWITLGLLTAAGAMVVASDRVMRVPPASARLRALFRGLAVLRRGSVLLPGLVLSGLAWGAGWLATYCCLVAVDIRPAPPAALLVMIVLQIGTALAGSPGGLGVFEYLCVVSLAVFHVPRDVAASCGLLLHVVAYGPPIVVGGLLVAAGVGRSSGLPPSPITSG
jgi:hypothetical protein